MNYSYFWLSTGLACLLILATLSTGACLFLVRRLDVLSHAHEVTERRVVQLAFELRRLERRASLAAAGAVGGDLGEGQPPPLANHEPPTSLISVPDLGLDGLDEVSTGLAEKHGEVWSLIEAGLTPQEIARETGRPIGQVEVILGLYRHERQSRTRGEHDGLS